MTLVEDDLKAPFSIATTPKCRGGRNSVPWIAPLYPWSISYNTERWHQVTFFEFLVWLDLGLNPCFPDHWWILYSLDQLVWSPLQKIWCPGYDPEQIQWWDSSCRDPGSMEQYFFIIILGPLWLGVVGLIRVIKQISLDIFCHWLNYVKKETIWQKCKYEYKMNIIR